MRRFLAILVVLSVLAGAVPASAAVFNFGDMSTSWGYIWDANANGGAGAYVTETATPWGPPPTSGPTVTTDEWGDPILRYNNSPSGEHSANVVWGGLKSVSIVYHNNGGTFWETLKPGDLFIDLGGDGTWDWVARTPFFADGAYFNANGTATALGATKQAAAWQVYSFPTPVDYLNEGGDLDPAGPYELAHYATPADSRTNWSGFTIRNYHPWALASVNGLTLVGTASFDGWDNLDGKPFAQPGASTWTFDKLLPMGNGDKFRVGWTVNCANDVLLGEVAIPLGSIDTPEPATIAIWGLLATLALGMNVVRRRRAGRQGWTTESRQAIHEMIDSGRRA